MKKERKTDRRTLYTIAAIKDAFIELTKEIPYEKISVKAICERADISRVTFYLHYDSLNTLLDEVLNDALLFSESDTNPTIDLIDLVQSGKLGTMNHTDAVLPACQRIANSERYHHLFMNSTLSEYIIMKIFNHEKDTVVPAIMKKTGVNRSHGEMLFRFVLYGSFHVNKALKWQKNKEWYDSQKTLGAFIDAGLKTLSN